MTRYPLTLVTAAVLGFLSTGVLLPAAAQGQGGANNHRGEIQPKDDCTTFNHVRGAGTFKGLSDLGIGTFSYPSGDAFTLVRDISHPYTDGSGTQAWAETIDVYDSIPVSVTSAAPTVPYNPHHPASAGRPAGSSDYKAPYVKIITVGGKTGAQLRFKRTFVTNGFRNLDGFGSAGGAPFSPGPPPSGAEDADQNGTNGHRTGSKPSKAKGGPQMPTTPTQPSGGVADFPGFSFPKPLPAHFVPGGFEIRTHFKEEIFCGPMLIATVEWGWTSKFWIATPFPPENVWYTSHPLPGLPKITTP